MTLLAAAEEEGSSCSWDNGACKIVEGVLGTGSAIAGNAATAALEAVAQGLANGAVAFLEMISTWWMNAPGPDLDNPAVASLQADMGYYIAAFAIIGFLFGLGRMVLSMDFKKIITAFAPIVTLIVVTGVYAVAIGALLAAGDSTAAWLLDRATEGDANLEILAAPVGDMGQNIGVFLIVSLLTFFGAIMNFLLMIFRDVTILVLLAFLPVVAASTGSVSGKQAFQKINSWLIALLLFKPVAAGIYALGLRMMTEDSEIEDLAGELQNYSAAMTGMLILALAGLALPALIKFIAPAAAMGAAAFGGGAAIAGAATVAAGAAVIGASGGAAAPAVAGGGTAVAGGSGAAASGGVGAAGGGGAVGAGASGAGAAGGASSGAAGSGAGQGAGASGGAGSAGGADGGSGGGAAGSTPGGATPTSGSDSGSDSSGGDDGSGESGAGGAAGGAESAGADSGGAAAGASSAGGAAGGAGGGSAAGGDSSGGSSGGGQDASTPAGASASGGGSASSGGGSGSGSEGAGGSSGVGVDAGTPGGAESSGDSSDGHSGSGGGAAASGASQNTGSDSGSTTGKTRGSGAAKTQQLKNVIDTGTASGAQINDAVEGDDGESGA
ncbi:hypothetical protein [Nesterenkonia lutea]|uniref:TrbL/VirB6 plasmid conjugal transfer protein n=1 Tax=Nesterenkonia lutea TaxID=272919 RepID=A0ABR9JI47_9MICC|nr:hypothetical protein [Nesterenkonia lutea]MBE1525491.1 hypothetical protein [Nesterenkonia lutea]